MARKITDRERLITFVLNATTEQLAEAKELIDTALRARAPKKAAKRAKRAQPIPNAVERNPPPED